MFASRMSTDSQQILANINQGRGTIGKLVNDDTLYQQVRQIADDAQKAMTNVREVTNEARRAIVDFRSKDGPANGLMADVKITLDQAREAIKPFAEIGRAH